MKILPFIAVAVVFIGLGWWIATSSSRSMPAAVKPTAQKGGPTTTVTEAAQVFQRAFWKRPTDKDRILKAERREWADSGGIQRWQWFIVVEPSPGLVRHLIDNNAFSLSPVRAGQQRPITDQPSWFPKDTPECAVLGSLSGNMVLCWDKAANRLYATDSGGGFHAGAPEKLKPQPGSVAATGRLPSTAPPSKPQP